MKVWKCNNCGDTTFVATIKTEVYIDEYNKYGTVDIGEVEPNNRHGELEIEKICCTNCGNTGETMEDIAYREEE